MSRSQRSQGLNKPIVSFEPTKTVVHAKQRVRMGLTAPQALNGNPPPTNALERREQSVAGHTLG